MARLNVTTTKPILIFAYGNPGRGDDALGPLLLEAMEQHQPPLAECQTDMQLQVEHVTDLEGRALILFFDADVSCAAPFAFAALRAKKDDSYTSHAMTPHALLHAFRQVYGKDAPPAFLLRIRGYDFELGEPLSPPATANLAAAVELVKSLVSTADISDWQQLGA